MEYFVSITIWPARKLIDQEVYRDMQDRPAGRFILPFISVLMLLGTSGCSSQGDLGRHSPSLVSKTYTSTFATARKMLGADEDYDLPLTAAEDALRSRAQDLQAVQYGGVVSQIVRPQSGDGFLQVAALIQDLRVERVRFAGFVEAARKTMQIDEARFNRLKGLDVVTARRQLAAVNERRGDNALLTRNGVRDMRERSEKYKHILLLLPVERPDVPLEELQAAYEAFHEDVVQFHGEIDQHAHRWLGRAARLSLK